MSATVNIVCAKGGTAGIPTYTSALTQFKFRSDDNPDTLDNTNSILKPSSGQHYSYWVHMCLDISGIFTQVSNIKVYTDGALGWSLGTAGDIIVGLKASAPHGLLESEYVPATGTQGETGDILNSTNHPNIASTGSLYAYTSASPLDVDDSTYTTATKSKMIVIQLVVDSDATAGAYSGENITWQWDEIP